MMIWSYTAVMSGSTTAAGSAGHCSPLHEQGPWHIPEDCGDPREWTRLICWHAAEDIGSIDAKGSGGQGEAPQAPGPVVRAA